MSFTDKQYAKAIDAINKLEVPVYYLYFEGDDLPIVSYSKPVIEEYETGKFEVRIFTDSSRCIYTNAAPEEESDTVLIGKLPDTAIYNYSLSLKEGVCIKDPEYRYNNNIPVLAAWSFKEQQDFLKKYFPGVIITTYTELKHD